MGLLNRLLGYVRRQPVEDAAALLEARGELDRAYEAYRATGRNDDAARILLARADSELDPLQRVTLLGLAASCATIGSSAQRTARQRKAKLRLDLARNDRGAVMPSELAELASELESLGLLQQAAEAYALAGDVDSQSRVLIASGDIPGLENALSHERDQRTAKQDRAHTFNSVRDLALIGRRRAAVERCEQWLALHPLDDEIASFARRLRDQLVRGRTINLHLEGSPARVALGDCVTIGRADATIVVPSPALSRQHLELSRQRGVPTLRDLQTTNGTWLAGARIDGPLPIADGIEIVLGKQIPCRIEPMMNTQALSVHVTGDTIVAPLGPFRVAHFIIEPTYDGLIELRSEDPARCPVLNGMMADAVIELSCGDEIRAARGEPIVLKVLCT